MKQKFLLVIFLLVSPIILTQDYENLRFNHWYEIDFSLVNQFERERNYKEADQWYDQIANEQLGEFLSHTREQLREYPYPWSFNSADEIYQEFTERIHYNSDLSDILPLIMNGSVLETDFFFAFNQIDSSRAMSTTVPTVSVSELIFIDNAYFFYVTAIGEENVDSFFHYYPTLVLSIKRIDDAIFQGLNGRYEITRMDWTKVTDKNIIMDFGCQVSSSIPGQTKYLYGILK